MLLWWEPHDPSPVVGEEFGDISPCSYSSPGGISQLVNAIGCLCSSGHTCPSHVVLCSGLIPPGGSDHFGGHKESGAQTAVYGISHITVGILHRL